MTEPLVVGRFKNGPLRFTQSTTIEALTKELTDRLPVDTIYTLIPNADGTSYHLKELAKVTLDFLPVDPLPATPALQPPAETVPSVPSPLVAQVTKALTEKYPLPEGEAWAVHPPTQDWVMLGSDHPEPKPQAQLEAERLASPPSQATPTPKRHRSPKAKPAALEATDNDIDSLPVTRAGKGRRVVNSIRDATPEEAAAASKNCTI